MSSIYSSFLSLSRLNDVCYKYSVALSHSWHIYLLQLQTGPFDLTTCITIPLCQHIYRYTLHTRHTFIHLYSHNDIDCTYIVHTPFWPINTTNTITSQITHTHIQHSYDKNTHSLNTIFIAIFFLLLLFHFFFFSKRRAKQRAKPAKWLAVGVWIPYWNVALAQVAINRRRAIIIVWLQTKNHQDVSLNQQEQFGPFIQ